MLIFVVEIIAKTSNIYFDSKLYRVSGGVKLVFEIILIYSLVTNLKRQKFLIYPLSFLICYFIGHFSLGKSFLDLFSEWTFGNLYFLNSFLFIFLFIANVEILGLRKETFPIVLKIFEKVILVNSALILLGLLFEIELFKTYPLSTRFGYNGVFAKNGEVSYFYMILISILYYNIIVNQRKSILKFIFIVTTSIVLGKKVMIFYLVLLGLFHLFFVYKGKRIIKPVVLVVVMTGVYFKNIIINVILNYSSFWANVHSEFGLLGALTSTRSLLLQNSIEHINNNWGLFNYFFGGINYLQHKVEFDFVDIFLFFGFFGTTIYILFLKNYFFHKEDKIKNYILTLILICSFFSGGLFFSVSSMLILYIAFREISKVEEQQLD